MLPRVRAQRRWQALYPELFATQLHHDCFIELSMLTRESETLPSLKLLYESLPYSENSIRTYLRSLANGGWISFLNGAPGDRRCKGLRIEPRFKAVLNEYVARLGPEYDDEDVAAYVGKHRDAEEAEGAAAPSETG